MSSQFRTGINFARIGLGAAVRARFSRDASRKYLIDQIGKLPGLPAKASQILSLKFGQDEAIHIEPLPLEWIKERLEERQPKFSSEIEEISSVVAVASLGQVHQVKMRSGERFAVKVRFPDVDSSLDDQLSILLLGLKKFGRSREFGLDVADYESFLKSSFQEELDYRHEAKAQELFRSAWRNEGGIVIPSVENVFSDQEILVQSFETSLGLEALLNLDEPTRIAAAEGLLRFFCRGLFWNGLLHADLHPKNWGYRQESESTVVYDFGSTLEVGPEIVAAFRRLALSSWAMSLSEIYECYEEIGFDLDKLGRLGERLKILTNEIFSPLSEENWHPAEWRLGEKFEKILGAEKWWFRTSGPAWFIQLIRSSMAAITTVNRLNVSIKMSRVLPREIPFAPAGLNFSSALSIQSSAGGALRVLVRENGKSVIELELPARAVDDLESLIPDGVMEKLAEQNIDLSTIKQRARSSGYLPQELFLATNGNREYRVWLA